MADPRDHVFQTLYEIAKQAGISPAELATMSAADFKLRVIEARKRKAN